jgi:hypothetical protein
MFGLESVEMGIAYIMSALAALLCLAYGIWKWNEKDSTDKELNEGAEGEAEDSKRL